MNPAAIQLHQLVFGWPRQTSPCINIPELVIGPGERIFLHGPSGSGKSTLLALLGGVALPQQGRISLLDTEITALSGRARDRFRADHIGFLFQQFNLLPWLSAIDNVLLPCTFSARRRQRTGQHFTPPRPPRAEAERLLQQLDLEADSWHKPAAELSVGQQQRVAAARALIGQPELLIADEPTSALDAGRQQIFVDLLLQETKTAGATLVFVSHDQRLAAHFDRQLELPAINRASSAGGAA
jgi:putative ABC transport system ATP-binding protein